MNIEFSNITLKNIMCLPSARKPDSHFILKQGFCDLVCVKFTRRCSFRSRKESGKEYFLPGYSDDINFAYRKLDAGSRANGWKPLVEDRGENVAKSLI